jgi:hypothetical protein
VLRILAVVLGLALVTIAALGIAAGSGTAWEPDRRATQDTTGAGQNETFIAANPLDPDNAVVVNKDYRAGTFDYLDTTTDGGLTWAERPFPSAGLDVTGNTDPSVFFRPDGRAYVLWTAEVNWPNAGLYCAWSDDGGLTWSAPAEITPRSGHYDDKAWFAFDSTGGPFNGNIYAAWTRFGLAEIDAARSTDGGATWSAATQISYSGWISDNDGPQPLLLPDGSVIIIFSHANPSGNATLVLSRSTDGGVTWGPDTALFNIVPPPYTLPGEHWRIFTYHTLVRDPVRGWLNLVWHDYRDGASNGIDILTSRSTDEGVTWSAPARLNDDAPGLVRDQWFPVLAAAPDGRLTALWLDRRDDPANRLYYAYSRTSTDGGLTWEPSVRVSSAASDPNLNIPPGADGIGDYIGLAAGQGVMWGSWVDTRNGNQDIYAARELFTPQPPETTTSTTTPKTTPTATNLPPTATVTPTNVSMPSPIPTRPASPTPCLLSFSDVHPEDFFYTPVLYLACHGVIGGYADGTFRPYNNTTRGQTAKIVVLAQRWPLPNPVEPTFEDVPPGSPFYRYIEAAAEHNIIGGYECGAPGEPCDPQNRPYFRWYNDVTRGQIAKIVVLARNWLLLNPPDPTFADVPAGSDFYPYVETAVQHGILSGYPCGDPEPCDPQNRPYFRPGNPATRGQIAKIVYNAVIGP